MANPPRSSLFQQRFLTGNNPVLKLDDEFLRNYTKVLLRTDTSERFWKVYLDGDRLAGGWEVFAGDNKFRDGDVLVFRHDGDENIHVSVSSRSNSGDIEHASPCNVESDSEYEYEYDDDDGEDEDDEDDDDGLGNISVRKNKKLEADSSSGRFVTAHVTRYSLHKDRLDLSRNLTVSLGEHNKAHEIDLVNKQGRRWTLVIAKNCSSGVFYIRRGWSNFCSTNGLKQGDLCKFKLVQNGEKPVLWLCSHESGNNHEEEECTEVDAVKNCSSGRGKAKNMSNDVSKGKNMKTPSSFLITEFTPNRFKNGQLYLSTGFTTENGITKPGETTLQNKDGRTWSSDIHMTGVEGNRWFYMRRGWREMCKANGVKVNDSFVLELVWEDANPVFKFHSKIENNGSKGKGNRRTRKKRACETDVTVEKTPTIGIEGRTRVSYRDTTTNSRKLQRTEPKSCSISDQVTNVKRSIVDTLNTVKQFRSELETREQNLEASLLEIDALGERILGISQILNHKLV
ncbi:hypothetical protein AALP_AA7G173600 [Arabis alpina]|uniref:TF-B3 domain-containing protein n=1 Tax=Arabis alpina TaxID=50452 RepID=A0A087GIP5_ARAAL|nr:hypothetical protein AALP_AA7G173600 [Arabis alpina]